MSSLRNNDKHILEKLLQMDSGYVLNFSDRTMAEFFFDELNLDIYGDAYSYASGSKANRMRGFWKVANDALVSRSILELLGYIETQILLGHLSRENFSIELTDRAKRIAEELVTNFSDKREPAPVASVGKPKDNIFDVFICHASEDKIFVSALVRAIEDVGITVWYDSSQISWGDDLRSAIDEGLKRSSYGIVVFSKAFLLKKKWTEYELNALFSKEKMGQKAVLPIWHNITRDDVAEYSLTFADRIAKRSDDIPAIVREFKELL